MTEMNPYNAVFADVSVVEHHLRIDNIDGSQMCHPAVSVRNRLVGQETNEAGQTIAVETSVRIGLGTDDPKDDVDLIQEIVVGCTVTAPSEGRGENSDDELLRYAVEANIGFARAITFAQTTMSTLPQGLIIPPMVFDGEIER